MEDFQFLMQTIRLPDLSSDDPLGAVKHFEFIPHFAFAALQSILIRCFDERTEERMRLQGLGLEFRMELAAQEIGMTGNLYDLHVSAVRSTASKLQAGAGQDGLISTREFITQVIPPDHT